MLLLTVTEFRNNIAKYLQMALTERIALKSKGGIIELTPSKEIRTTNPSPSNDPWFDVPENMASVERGSLQAAQGLGTPLSELKKEFGL